MKKLNANIFISQIPNGIVLAKGSTIKITVLEIYSQWNNGWIEQEYYGLEDLDVINQLVWKAGETVVAYCRDVNILSKG